jgi:hypothetical protein
MISSEQINYDELQMFVSSLGPSTNSSNSINMQQTGINSTFTFERKDSLGNSNNNNNNNNTNLQRFNMAKKK